MGAMMEERKGALIIWSSEGSFFFVIFVLAGFV
jgi:hypothetical protein